MCPHRKTECYSYYIRNNCQPCVFVSSCKPQMAKVNRFNLFDYHQTVSLTFDFSTIILSTLKARITSHFELRLINGT